MATVILIFGSRVEAFAEAAVPAPARPPLRQWRWFRALRWMATVLLIVGAVRTFVGEASLVPTGSMEGTILTGDHIFLNKALYGPEVPLLGVRLPRLKTVRRGDIVAFRHPRQPQTNFLKRVVAIGGDQVEIRDDVLFINGSPVTEPYAVHRWHPTQDAARRESMRALRVPAGQLFVLGDNRDDSADSRYWGTVPEANVMGEPLLVYWSYDAPAAAWLEEGSGHRLRFYGSIAAHLFTRTRWSRVGTLL